ncbi:MAG: CpsD/CapB family tyrosine-protein kinase [Sphingomonadales bacterium]|nr:CpsD/CapB family tyrosine-protein kinase [Sphingomonadales bacterium]
MKLIEGRLAALALAFLSLILGVIFEGPLSDFVRDLGFDSSNLNPSTRTAISGVVCFVLGIAFALGVLRNSAVEAWFTARRLRKLQDLEDHYGKPMAGWLPFADDPILELSDPKSEIYEAMSSIHDRVMNDFGVQPPREILVTSGIPAEGKSTFAFGLAKMLAGRGRRVLLIDADLRAPSQHYFLGQANEFGLSNLAAGEQDVGKAIVQTSALGLSAIYSGPQPPNAGVLLSSSLIAGVIKQFQEQFDVVVIDSPPVLGLADTPALARICDCILYVVRYGFTNSKLAADTFKRISSSARAPIILAGTALPSNVMGFGYSYSYSYGRVRFLTDAVSNSTTLRNWLTSYFWRGAALAVSALAAYAIFSNWNPDRLDRVGSGVTSAHVVRDWLVVETWHGEYRDIKHALLSSGEAVERLSMGIKSELPPLRPDTKRVLVRFSFSKDDRLGNSVRVPMLILVFSRNDLARANLKSLNGLRLLALGQSVYVWQTGWGSDIKAFCRKPPSQTGFQELCAELNSALLRRSRVQKQSAYIQFQSQN